MFIARCWTLSVMIEACILANYCILFVGGAGWVSVYCTFEILIHFWSDLIIVGKHSSSFKHWWTRSYLLLLWAVPTRGRHSDSSSNLVLCILFSYNWLHIHPQISSSCRAPTWQSHSFLLLMILPSLYHFILYTLHMQLLLGRIHLYSYLILLRPASHLKLQPVPICLNKLLHIFFQPLGGSGLLTQDTAPQSDFGWRIFCARKSV